jgi:sugar phosphate isomerase/epimerase
VLGSRIASVHVHDNKGLKDEHLWPGDGTIAWPATVEALKKLAPAPACVLEIHYTLGAETHEVSERIEKAFALFA